MLKQYFKGWGFNLQGELRKQRKSISEELSDLEKIEEVLDSILNNCIEKHGSLRRIYSYLIRRRLTGIAGARRIGF